MSRRFSFRRGRSLLTIAVVIACVCGGIATGVSGASVSANSASTDAVSSQTVAAQDGDEDADAPLSLSLEAPDADPGGQTTVAFSLGSQTDDVMNGVSLEVTVPDGWEILEYEADGGAFNSEERAWFWFEMDGDKEPSLTLSIPEDAEQDTYTVSAVARDLDDVGVSATTEVSVHTADDSEEGDTSASDTGSGDDSNQDEASDDSGEDEPSDDASEDESTDDSGEDEPNDDASEDESTDDSGEDESDNESDEDADDDNESDEDAGDDNESSDETDENGTSNDDYESDSVPGFGVSATVLALAVGLAIVSRRRSR